MVLKRIFSFAIIFSLIAFPAFADVKGKINGTSKVIPPSWSEFCPEEYINASPINNIQEFVPKMCKPDKFLWGGFVNLVTVVPILYCGSIGVSAQNQMNKYNQNIAYWQDRKELFDAAISTCVSAPVVSQAACYMQVRQLELQRKQLALQSLQADIMYSQSRTQSLNNINQTIQMQNMNSNMNNINNNLNRLYYH